MKANNILSNCSLFSSMCQGCNVDLTDIHFLSHCTFCISFFPTCSFARELLITTPKLWLLCCLESFSSQEMNHPIFDLSSGKFLGQGQKAVGFLAKASKEDNYLRCYQKTLVLDVNIALSHVVFQLPSCS